MPIENGKYLIATGGIQAPTIRYHKGKFYIITTNTSREDPTAPIRDNFIISTSDIWSGQWSDPVHFDFYGIDTSFFIDDDERCFIQGSWMMDREEQPKSTIYQVELDLETGKALSDTRLIWEGHFQYDTEGPHIYKRGEWYYLLAAEGGTFEHHKLSMARSRNVWGPYESYEHNPILTAEGTKEYIQGVGHGELFQDGDGDWWIVALGFRSHNGVWPLGRETFLSKVDWPEGGWPKIEQPRGSFESKKLPSPKNLPGTDKVSDIVYLRGRNDDNYQLLQGPDQDVARLRPSQITLDDVYGLPTFLGRRQPNISATGQVALDIRQPSAHGRPVLAGLTLHLDPLRYAYLAFDFTASQLRFKAINVAQDFTRDHTFELNLRKDLVHLKVEASAERYAFFYSLQSTGAERLDKKGERAWKAAGIVSTAELSDRHFTGPLFGIFAQSTAAGCSDFVTFRGFQVQEIDSSCNPETV